MTGETTNIHRHLDEAFAEAPPTSELQDLKEELRANLAARVAELVAAGEDPERAASRAIREMGDVRELIRAVAAETGPDDGSAAYRVHRVRPRAGFVVRTVLLSLVLTAAATITTLGALHVVTLPLIPLVAIALLGAAVPGGAITADSLLQETTVHYPAPPGRAVLYGISVASGLAGLALGGLWLGFPQDGPAPLVVGIVLAVLCIVGLSALGATQTNRTKAWVHELHRTQYPDNPFEQDPVTAARFGVYTLVIWVLAITGFVVLSMTVGFAWSWLALVAGMAVFMLVLARMLFLPRDGSRRSVDASRSKVE